MKILLLDIETSPNTASVWGMFKQNISVSQLLESSQVLCWAARWYGDSVTYFDSIHRSTHKAMIKRIHKMLDEADAVVHYNGRRFDIPTLNKEFILHGIAPPAPYKHIDLLTTARSQFRFPSNKLEYVASRLGLGGKKKHEGHELWLKCMNKDSEAWKVMEDYNIQDVELLEQLYDRFKPWIRNHPNHSVHSGETVCPNCGGKHFQRRGFAHTLAGVYQRYQCSPTKGCGNWFRDTKNVANKNKFVTSGV